MQAGSECSGGFAHRLGAGGAGELHSLGMPFPWRTIMSFDWDLFSRYLTPVLGAAAGLKFHMDPARNPIPCLGLREMGVLGF